jgi:hypothetical protein
MRRPPDEFIIDEAGRELETDVEQVVGEASSAVRQQPDVDKGVRVHSFPFGDDAVLETVEQDHLTPNEDPAAGERVGELVEEAPLVNVDPCGSTGGRTTSG